MSARGMWPDEPPDVYDDSLSHEEWCVCSMCHGEAGHDEPDQSASRWSLDPPGCHWVPCPECRGTGLEEGINQLDFYDLEERCGA